MDGRTNEGILMGTIVRVIMRKASSPMFPIWLLFLLAGGFAAPASLLSQEERRVVVVGQDLKGNNEGEGRRWAIIIGVDRYQNANVPTLHGAVADAKAVADALVSYADFLPGQLVTLTTDGTVMPTSANIVDQFAELRDKVKPGDLLVVFFAGHGVEVEGRRFLLTYEAQINSPGALKTSTLPVSILMQEVESLPVTHRIIMVDACRDDPLNPGKKTPNIATPLMETAFTLQPSNEAGVRATFLSCSRGESAYEWTEKGRGFFSYYVERGLSGEAAVYGKVTLNSLADYLNENVSQAVRQERGRTQTPFSDVKGESFTLVRGEKLAVKPDHLRMTGAQTRTVYGVVKDGSGAPLVGTLVRMTWDQTGTRGPANASSPLEARISTDEDGFFKAEVPADAVVSVSAETSGFQVQTVKASPQESGRKIRLFLPRLGAAPALDSSASGVTGAAARAQELAGIAYQSFQVEEFENAERVAREALDVDRNNRIAQAVMANCHAVRGVNKADATELALAREISQKLLEQNPNDAFAHNAMGLVFVGAKNLKSSSKEFDAAIALNPELAMSQANLGHVYLELGQLKEAEKAYRAAIRLRPEDAVPRNGLARVLLKRGEAGGAVKAARAAISRYELRDVYLASFYVNLAVALFQDGEEEQALEAVARAKNLGLEQNPAYEPIEQAARAKAQKKR
ncbi:MAG: hypothetical protein A2W25_17435 [candidate division Zixibacteria bacterium RBG_16_53_22]|nr:MAG: hypothetical protein A2W25_17435 [candidate division Zixibacteria bacterium RBG_16_53_22]